MKSATDLEEDKFAVLGLKKYCCHCQLSESDTRAGACMCGGMAESGVLVGEA